MSFFSFLRPRYSIRALLVLMTLFALFFWYHISWIRQRHAAVSEGWIELRPDPTRSAPRAPGLLWLFGEPGYTDVEVRGGYELPQRRFAAFKLFPESSITSFPGR